MTIKTPSIRIPRPAQAADSYRIEPPPAAAVTHGQEMVPRRFALAGRTKPMRTPGLWSSIALRFGGFASAFRASIEPIGAGMSDPVARIFFREKLPGIVESARRNPAAAHRMILETRDPEKPIWGALAGVACGDSAALLAAMDALDERAAAPAVVDCALEVARARPEEGKRLLTHAFGSASTPSRLRIFARFVEDPRLGPSRAIGDLFIKLMARSTPEERNAEIYPSLIDLACGGDGAASPRRGFLAAILRGWISECPPGQVNAGIEGRIHGLLG